MTRRVWPWLGLISLLLLTWLVYTPGLSGGFLFDDFVNLDALGATGPIDNWPAFWRYVTSGTADPTGRPLALLSFLINARDWPADPAGFLQTNLLLHLINGCLLFTLLRMLGRALRTSDTANDSAALLASGLWLLHPLLVSTTLYIVQREAMLPTTFTLAGLVAYSYGRQRLQESALASGSSWMIAGVVGGGILALLSKGNGVLLPVLAWALEATVFGASANGVLDDEVRRRQRHLKFFLLIAPSCLLFAYLLSKFSGLGADLPSRPWTLGQRLLTEPRVLLDYLQLLLVPRSISTGLYNDAYPVSVDWWHPATTIPAMALIAGLLLVGVKWRRRAPRLSAAILFFLAGHMLESTIIPLELYFEHRNYLPALLLFWPLAHALCSWRIAKWLRIAIATAALALFALTTWQRAVLWGQPDQLAKLWAIQNPESSRARATEALMLISAGQDQRAAELLGPLWKRNRLDMQLAFNYIDATCHWRGLSPADRDALSRSLARSNNGELLIHQWLGRAIDVAASGLCPGLTLDDVETWIMASAASPGISPPGIRDQTIEPLLARLAIERGQPVLALKHFNRALLAFTTPDAAARNASFLASAGYYVQALSHLDYYERIRSQGQKPGAGMPWLHAKVLDWQGYWPREMAILRQKLAAEIAMDTASSAISRDESDHD